MNDLAQFALVPFTSILFLVDPVAVIPAYLAFTRTDSPSHRRRTARVACVVAGVALLIFSAGGDPVPPPLRLTPPAVPIAGGVLLWFFPLDMLRAHRPTPNGE